jgi:hypothetical protein
MDEAIHRGAILGRKGWNVKTMGGVNGFCKLGFVFPRWRADDPGGKRGWPSWGDGRG